MKDEEFLNELPFFLEKINQIIEENEELKNKNFSLETNKLVDAIKIIDLEDEIRKLKSQLKGGE